MKNSRATILDCTLRDGGYYTNWNFDKKLVTDYFNALNGSGVNVIELGYLDIDSKDKGRFAYIDSKAANDILKNHGYQSIQFSVMLDAKQFFKDGSLDFKELNARFGPKNKSSIDIIRVAVHYSFLKESIPLIQNLKLFGYRVILNLMQIDLASTKELDTVVSLLNKVTYIEVVYIADSFGSMLPDRVDSLISYFVSRLKIDVGFHGHNNRGLAILNTIQAYDSGAKWLDCTISGMGRGAGNASTEQLLPVLLKGLNSESIFPIQKMIADHFHDLKQHYNWSDNIFYNYGAVNFIHPTIVQNVFSNNIEEKGSNILSNLIVSKKSA